MFSQVFVCPPGVSVSVRGGGGGLRPGGLRQGDPPYGNEQVVRILLECILV